MDGAARAEWVERNWLPVGGPGLGRGARRGGTYLAFIPAPLVNRHVIISSELARKADRVERKIRALARREAESTSGLEGVSRFLLRSEAISSSRIEGIAPGPDKVAIAEIINIDGDSRAATVPQLVANNVRVLQELSRRIHDSGEVNTGDIISMQALLLGGTAPGGFRDQQNWIGGSNYSPLEAEFVPPPPEFVPELMNDLMDYLGGAAHGALIQAALVHAQFETIHPFADGNGRVGRALIQAVLQRRGLVESPVLPVSMVLGTWSQHYVDGLTQFRETGGSSGGVYEWIDVFLDAADEAADQAGRIAGELDALQAEWQQRMGAHRAETGMTRALRSDSIEHRILVRLADHPLLTAPVAAEIFGASRTSAGKALENLAAAGIVQRKSIDRGVTGYLADDVFELITLAERRLASTRFDMAIAPPTARPTPAPQPPRDPAASPPR